MSTRQEQYKDQVVQNLINETKLIYNKEVDWYTVELPFLQTKGNGNRKDHFNKHVMDNYGILFCEVDDIWNRYTKYIMDLHESVIGRKDLKLDLGGYRRIYKGVDIVN